MLKIVLNISIIFLCIPVIAQNDSSRVNILLRDPIQKVSLIQDLNLNNYKLKNNIETDRVNKVIGITGFVLKEVLRSKSFYDPNLCSPAIY